MESAGLDPNDTPNAMAASLGPTHWRKSEVVLFLVIVSILIGIAVRCGWLATHDLRWPFDWDLFRDAASAQSMLDGQFPTDPFYKGEQNWYNPLGPGVVAFLSSVTGVPPAEFYARHGAWPGIAIPLGILFLASVLFGRWSGVMALFAFLFLAPDHVAAWAGPCFTPWLFANIISLVPFCLTLSAAILARQNNRALLWLGCGFFLGATFLAHTASAVIAGCIVVVLAWKRNEFSASVGRWAMLLAAALATSLPLLVSIVAHYQLRIQNTAPIDYVFFETDVHRANELLWNSLTFGNTAAAAGLVLLFVRRPAPGIRAIFIVWIFVAAAFFLFGYARQLWPAFKIPALVPSFHWLFQLRLAVPFLAGYALWFAAVRISAFLGRRWTVPAAVPAIAIMAVILFFRYPQFAARYDFTLARTVETEMEAVPGVNETITWLRHELPRDTVVLSSPVHSLLFLGAAGKKAVVLPPEFSNPYVPYAPRAQAADTLFKALVDHDSIKFHETAAKYAVSHILLASSSASFIEACTSAPFVKQVFAHGAYVILRIED